MMIGNSDGPTAVTVIKKNSKLTWKQKIEKCKKENEDVMEENKKLFEVIDMLQQIKEKSKRVSIIFLYNY